MGGGGLLGAASRQTAVAKGAARDYRWLMLPAAGAALLVVLLELLLPVVLALVLLLAQF